MSSATLPKISQAGLDVLKAFETLSLVVYPDQAGRPTIGWGHKLRGSEAYSRPITREKADELLESDLGWAQACVRAWVCTRLEVRQREFDALVVLCFNIGAIAFQNSTLRDKLIGGDRAGAAEEFLRWDKIHDDHGNVVESKGLAKRRKAERALFLGLIWSPP